MNKYKEPWWETVWGLLLIVTGSAIVIIAMPAVAINHASWPSERAGIEQLRHDVAVAEDRAFVVGMAAEVNVRIVKLRVYDAVPVVGWFVPDGWSEVKVIDL